MKLHEFSRSSASYRTRIALNLKGLDYETVQVHLVKREQFDAAYMVMNPQARVPTLVLDGGETLIQSPAILEWLEEAACARAGDGGAHRLRYPSAEQPGRADLFARDAARGGRGGERVVRALDHGRI